MILVGESQPTAISMMMVKYTGLFQWRGQTKNGLRTNISSHYCTPLQKSRARFQSEAGEIDKASASLRKLLLLDPALTVQSYLARSPAGANDTRKRYANALQRAGLPIH